MIEISALTEDDLMRRVVYQPVHQGTKPEKGFLTAYNDTYIFVRFQGQGQGSMACRPQDVSFDNPSTPKGDMK